MQSHIRGCLAIVSAGLHLCRRIIGLILSAALLLAVSGTSAYAVTPAPVPPVRQSVDANGVDLVLGSYTLSSTALSIGPSDNGGMVFAFENGRDTLAATMNTDGYNYYVSIGGRSDHFTKSGTVFTSATGNGATLTLVSTTYTYTASDGTVAIFVAANGTYDRFVANDGWASSITFPDGTKWSYFYRGQNYCPTEYDPEFPNCLVALKRGVRLQSVTNNRGYQMKLTYQSNTLAYLPDVEAWNTVIKVQAINNAVEYCNPSADSCTLTQSWPYVNYSNSGDGGSISVSDADGTMLQAVRNLNQLTVKIGTSVAANVTVNYATDGKVANVTAGGVTWNYSFTDSGNVRTTVVTGPSSTQRAVVSDITTKLITSDTDALNRTTSYTYDNLGRVEVVTYPEGNATKYVYDARGNVRETRQIPKPGSPALPDIISYASYPASCSNPRTCNQPDTTTDPKGKVTNYTYASHGGVASVTLPAPTTGAIRPESRYSYTALQAYYKNSGGSIVPSGLPVTLLTGTSACQTTASCTGTADEAKTTIDYGPQSAGTANNLLALSTASGSGNGSLTATVSATYDSIGNRLTVDGPLAGTGDVTRTRYDIRRRVVGIVGPDPDGAGALKHRAVRYTFNGEMLLSSTEVGTVNSQSDPDWAAMTVLQTVTPTYDAYRRRVKDVLSASSTSYQVTQYSYDAAGRPECTALRMNAAQWNSLPASACTQGIAGADGRDRVTRAVYNIASQITTIQKAYGTTLQANDATYTYTNNGQVATVADAKNNLTTYEYDRYDRLSKTRFPSPTAVGTSSTTDYSEATYDDNGNVTALRLRDGQSIGMTYDAINRVTFKDLPGSDPDGTYGYDLLSRLTSASQSGNALSFSYDALGRNLTQGGPHGTVSYAYDLAGRRTQMTWPDSFYVTYDYLLTNEMTAVRESGATSGIGVLATFGYDNLGNRTSTTRGNGTTSSYGYDPVSRMTSMAQNLTGTAQDLNLTFTYSAASQIKRLIRSNDLFAPTLFNTNRSYTTNGLNQYTVAGPVSPTYGLKGNLTTYGSAAYGYDSENHLISGPGLTLSYDPVGRLYQTSGSTTTRLAYDGQDLIAEYNASNVMQRRYVHGPSADEPIVWYEGSGTTDRRWLHADERGSIVAVSNASGASIGINSYDDYGTPGGANIGRFQYTGQTWIAELGLYYYKARFYHPVLGRFLQPDPIGYSDGMNLYAYAGNDPVNGRDPSGTYVDVRPRTGTLIPNHACNSCYVSSYSGPAADSDNPSDKKSNSSSSGSNSPTPPTGGRQTPVSVETPQVFVITAREITNGVYSNSVLPQNGDLIVNAQYKPGGNLNTPMKFDPLDPTRINRPLMTIELNGITNVLNILSGKDSRRVMALNPHNYKNFPSSTGAQLPPSPKGYTSLDVFVTAPRGPFRVLINNGSGQVYYTNNHYQSFYQIVQVPGP